MDLLIAAPSSIALAGLAFFLGVVTLGGALVGLALALAFSLAPDPNLYCLFFLFVVVGSAASKLGRAEKERHGIAQASHGRRGPWHALANTLPSALFLFVGLSLRPDQQTLFLIASAAALSAMLSDTVAGEVGAWLGGTPRMILSGRLATKGDNGAVSVVGLFVGAAFAAIGGVVASWGHGRMQREAWIVGLAAMAGNLLDSVLGQVIEHRLGPSGGFIVNASASALAGGVALALCQMW